MPGRGVLSFLLSLVTALTWVAALPRTCGHSVLTGRAQLCDPGVVVFVVSRLERERADLRLRVDDVLMRRGSCSSSSSRRFWRCDSLVMTAGWAQWLPSSPALSKRVNDDAERIAERMSAIADFGCAAGGASGLLTKRRLVLPAMPSPQRDLGSPRAGCLCVSSKPIRSLGPLSWVVLAT